MEPKRVNPSESPEVRVVPSGAYLPLPVILCHVGLVLKSRSNSKLLIAAIWKRPCQNLRERFSTRP